MSFPPSLSILAPGHRPPHPLVLFPHTPCSGCSFWVPRLHFPRPLCPRSSLGVFKVFLFFVFLRRRRCKKLAHTPSPSGPTPTQYFAVVYVPPPTSNPALPLYLPCLPCRLPPVCPVQTFSSPTLLVGNITWLGTHCRLVWSCLDLFFVRHLFSRRSIVARRKP